MDEQDFSLLNTDKEKIKLAVELHTPIEITTYTLPKNMEVYIQEVVGAFLTECHQQHMIEYVKFCISELLTNSKKANTKRVYFAEKGLNINNEEDYNEGMIFFKDETLMNIDHYLEEQKKIGLYIKLILRITDSHIKIEIKNNSVLTTFESQRIQEKLKLAQQYDRIEEVFTNVLDQTEGAGLGIMIIILMLQKIGLSKDSYKVITTDKETITSICLPLNQSILNKYTELCMEFAECQTKIPVIRENLDLLVSKLSPSTAIPEDTIEIFSKDPTLTLLLMKNAAIASDNCCSISQAVALLGIDGLRSLFCNEKTQEIIRLIEAEEDKDKLWEKSSEVAFYAYNLAKNHPCQNIKPEEMFVFAMLLNIECLLVEVATPEQKARLEECARKGNDIDNLESAELNAELIESIDNVDMAPLEALDVEESGDFEVSSVCEELLEDSEYIDCSEFLDDDQSADEQFVSDEFSGGELEAYSSIEEKDYGSIALNLFYKRECHSQCGFYLLKSIGLNEKISSIIKYSNDIETAPDEIKDIVEYVYLANILQLYIQKKVEYYQLDSRVLNRFGIDAESKLIHLVDLLSSVLN